MAAVSFALFILAIFVHFSLGKFAEREIKAIAKDPTAAYEVKKIFNAL